MFEELKINIKHQKKLLLDIEAIRVGIESDSANKDFFIKSSESLMEQFKLLNDTVPELLKEWSPILKKSKGKSKTVKMSYVSPSTKEKKFISINKGDRKKFLEKLRLSESGLTSLKKIKEEVPENIVKKPNPFVSFSNKYFRKYSEKIVPNFANLSKELKKANIRFLMSTYISMAIASTIISFFVGFVLFVILLAFNISNWIYFWIPFASSGLTVLGFYLYPSSEASMVQKAISQELPFATIHMSAIAGSQIEPSKIFKIIAMSKEYPNVGKEIRKVITQVEIYGYDLVTSLKNVASRTSNKKLADLLSGFATNISTGGALKNYLEKKAENYLLDYKLERKKYTDLAGTFMDIYISILIAAPLVLMMMFIVMNVAGLGLGGLGITTVLIFSIMGIVFVNIIFLIVLNFKQPAV